MQLTWFGGTTFRINIGGEIVVVDAGSATLPVNSTELQSGADHRVRLGEGPPVDPVGWRPRPAPRATDPAPPLEILCIGPAATLIAAAGEPPLVILGSGALPRFGRWADGAVVVMTSDRTSLVAEVTALLDVARLRLVAMAGEDAALDHAITALAEHLDGAGLAALEAGLALEV